MSKFLFLILFVFSVLPVFSQKKYTISGTIKDGSTGEQLIGATVKIKKLPQNGTVTNGYGFYSISAPQGEYTLLFTYTGYQTLVRQVSLHQSQVVNISLHSGNELNEVVVSANKPNNDNVASPQMGQEKL